MLRFSALIFAALLVAVQSTTVKQCKIGSLPLNVDIEGCTEPPCDVTKGSTATMLMHFVANKDYKSLKAKAVAYLGFIATEYALDDSVANVCENLLDGASCPIYKSEDVVYNFQMGIESWYPEIGVRVEVSIVDDKNDVVSCFSVNIKVKGGSAQKSIDHEN